MTLVICFHVSHQAAVPLVPMLIKLMYEAVLMANITNFIHYLQSYIILLDR